MNVFKMENPIRIKTEKLYCKQTKKKKKKCNKTKKTTDLLQKKKKKKNRKRTTDFFFFCIKPQVYRRVKISTPVPFPRCVHFPESTKQNDCTGAEEYLAPIRCPGR